MNIINGVTYVCIIAIIVLGSIVIYNAIQLQEQHKVSFKEAVGMTDYTMVYTIFALIAVTSASLFAGRYSRHQRLIASQGGRRQQQYSPQQQRLG
jgi:hypothetical protein